MRPRRNKYGNTKCEFDGIKFDSKKELKRYHELKLMLTQEIISDLEVHRSFPLVIPNLGPIKIKGPKQKRISRFIPDFVYKKSGVLVVEDVKSHATANEKYFKLKRAVFETIYQIDVQIV